MRIPLGYRAVWAGEEYEASPAGQTVRLYAEGPIPGFAPIKSDRYLRIVPAAEVERFWHVRTVAQLDGLRVVLLASYDGHVLVEYVDDPVRAADGVIRMESGVYWRWVEAEALRGVREVRV